MKIKGSDSILMALIPIGGFFADPDDTYTVCEEHIEFLKKEDIPFEVLDRKATVTKRLAEIKI